MSDFKPGDSELSTWNTPAARTADTRLADRIDLPSSGPVPPAVRAWPVRNEIKVSGALLALGPRHLRVITRARVSCQLILPASTCGYLGPGRVVPAPRLAEAACSARPDRYTPD